MPTLTESIRELDPLVRQCISQIFIYDSDVDYPVSLLIACEVRPGDVSIPGLNGLIISECVVNTERPPLTSESLKSYTLALEVRRMPNIDGRPSPHDQLRDLRRSRLCGTVRWRKDHSSSSRDVFWGATTHSGSLRDRRKWLVMLQSLLGYRNQSLGPKTTRPNTP